MENKQSIGLGWYLLSFFAVSLSIRASQYISLNPMLFEASLRERYLPYLPIVAVHAASSISALLIGPAAFHSRLRAYSLRLHRIAGRFYFLGVLIGSITGIYMACRAHGGPIAQIGLFSLAICWLITGWLGLLYAVRRKLRVHQRWMNRNYALTFAAVTLRLEVSALMFLGLEYTVAYRIVAWSSWRLNLIAVEYFLRRKTA